MSTRKISARSQVWLLCLAAVLMLAACDEKTLPTAPEEVETLISLAVSATSVVADGLSEVTLTATIRSEDPDPSKLDVEFRTTGGTLLGGATSTDCAAPLCTTVPADLGTLAAVARLRSSTTARPVTVTATLKAVGVSTRQQVDFTAGSPVLAFVGTVTTGEADGETAIRVIVEADARVAPGKMVTVTASNGMFVGGSASADLPLGSDHRVETQLRSRATPGTTLLTASVQGETLAAARHEIAFSPAFADSITLATDMGTLTADASATLTAEYFRTPGTGQVSAGLRPSWRADKVDASGDVLVANVGRISDVTLVEANAGDPPTRKSTATFSPQGLVAGDRIAITVELEDGSIRGQVVLTIA